MQVRIRLSVLASLLVAGASPLSAQTSAGATDAGVTPALIARGDSIYHGPGNCYACHGAKGVGLVGPSLTDGEWIHSRGTFEEIVTQIDGLLLLTSTP